MTSDDGSRWPDLAVFSCNLKQLTGSYSYCSEAVDMPWMMVVDSQGNLEQMTQLLVIMDLKHNQVTISQQTTANLYGI